MPPGDIYFLAIALIGIPLLPFSRSAFVVCAAWLPGQLAYLIGGDTSTIDMCVGIIAFGGALGLAANERDKLIAVSYLATAAVHFAALTSGLHPYYAWWYDWYLAMFRVLFLPATIDWSSARHVYEAFKERRELNMMIWRRAMCW